MKKIVCAYLRCGVLALSLALAGCATRQNPASTRLAGENTASSRTGRLALQIEQQPPQSFFIGFEWTGNAEQGHLRLFTPLGSTVATAHWSPEKADLQQGNSTRTYPSLDALLSELTGAQLPAAALFAWMDGRNVPAAGWQADLSQYSQGKIRAQRLDPLPAAKLQVILQ